MIPPQVELSARGETVRITVYDGAGVIGGNKILLEDGDTAVFLDFGMSFGTRGLYFEEFLKPRSASGLADLLEFDLLPPLPGLYRTDMDTGADDLWQVAQGRPGYRRLDHLDGVVVSHAHVDHTGYLSFLRPDIPVYTSPITAVIAKAIQDTAPSDFEREVFYQSPRTSKNGLLASAPRDPLVVRPFYLFGDGEIGEELASFWFQKEGLRPVTGPLPAVAADRIGNLHVRYFPVDHSIPGAMAFALETSAGWVVYTGDLRLHGKNGDATRRFAAEAAKLHPVCLICEGTHPDTQKPVTEEEVYDNADPAVAREPGLVIADFGPRNVERLLTFRAVAEHNGRRLAVLSKDAYLLAALHRADPRMPDPAADPGLVVYVKNRVQRQKWEECFLDSYASDHIVSWAEVRAHPEEFILCLSFWDLSELIDLKTYGGTYIYSSSEAYDEEAALDLQRLRNWLNHFQLRMVGDPGDRQGVGREPGFHASGHIHGPGLDELIRTIAPRYLVPVHTQNRGFFERFRDQMQVIWPGRGQPITLP